LINLGKRTLEIKRLVIFNQFFMLTLNIHVVHDHITVHALLHLRLRQSKSKIHENSKSMLKHSQCPLYIFPTSLLAHRKVRLLLRAWRRNGLHKCRTLRIDTIGEVLRVAVDLKVHHRCLSLRKSRKHWRALQHVDVIVSSAIPKKAC
jgi:hypothetical protein